ncbi:MAG: hypothetical protein DWP97_09520 [Calditrichaeota bacterium]|nr:MAG: hypothetical protein DWP97_09520 [Calditrichota bacterium]
MRKYIVLTILLLTSATIFAGGAFERRSQSVGGGASFVFQSGDLYNDFSSLSLSTKYSRAVSYGTFFGGIVELNYLDIGSYSSTDYFFGLILEKYLKSSENSSKAFPYLKTTAMIGSISESTAFSAGIHLGMAFMISDAIALEIGGVYTYNHFSYSGESVSGNIIQANAGLTTFIF